MNRHLVSIIAVVLFAALPARTVGQGVSPTNNPGAPGQPPFAPPQAPANVQSRQTPIKLQVVLSKYQGDKRLSSQPYTMLLTSGSPASLAIGAEVAIPTTVDQSAYTLQRIGTDLQATVSVISDNSYQLTLTVTDRSHFVSPKPDPAREKFAHIPTFRSLTTSSRAVMANGETIQFTSALDPASNETLRVDVTLSVGNK
jgi:hypothetical protein